MLDSKSRKMLIYLQKYEIPEDDYDEITFDDFYEKYTEYAGISESIAQAQVRYLEKLGYIRYCATPTGFLYGFSLELKAYSRVEFAHIELVKFLFKSIIVPIFVAAVTSLVCMWLNGVFK